MGQSVLQQALQLGTDGKIISYNSQYIGIGSKGANALPGLVGQDFVIETDAQALLYSSTANLLYRGRLKLVKVKTGVTLAFGESLYWSDEANYIVTNDSASGTLPFAGTAACTAGTALFYVYMVVPVRGNRGVAKFLNSPTKTTPAVGDTIVGTSTAGRLDVLADATAVTWATNKPLGRLETAIDATSHLATMNFGF